jgi:alkanesulfonate monooxygenase SsuD/methylene tetrahydromethanopterin reductase-like flavin-dependent oxidoreductase (luciferase family)
MCGAAAGVPGANVCATEQPTFGLWHHLRNPPSSGRTTGQLYAECLDQAQWAEELGFGSYWLTEHHLSSDGYCPSPLVFAAAVTTRTKRMRISADVLVATLHHPVRLAEDAAMVSLLSGGRLDLGIGMGYREIEFEAFGRRLLNRPSLFEETIEILRRAWAGESVEFRGRRYTLPDVVITPLPEHAPAIFIGATTEPGVRRAARLGDGYVPLTDLLDEHVLIYRDELEAAGRAGHGRMFAGIGQPIIAEDPEREWAKVGPYALYQTKMYVEWEQANSTARGGYDFSGLQEPDDLLRAGMFQLWDGPTAVAELAGILDRYPELEDIHFWGHLPGEPVDSGSNRLEFLARRVLPEVRRQLADTGQRSALS